MRGVRIGELLLAPRAGKWWYWSEQIQPTVSPGQTVSAGQVVATYAPSGTGIETGWWDEVPSETRQETFAAFAQRAPVRRNGQPEDVAQAIVALIENGFITGVVLPVDGGLRLT